MLVALYLDCGLVALCDCSGRLFSLGWAYAYVEDIRRAREKCVVANDCQYIS
jgi:hypothetical protein